MCDPVSLTALALTVGGSALQYRSEQDRRRDMQRLNRGETERQNAFYAESKKYLDDSQSLYDKDKVDADMLAAADSRQQQYAEADRQAPRANEKPVGAMGGNQVVNEAFARALADATQKAAQQGAARSELASFGDVMGNNAIAAGRNSGNIGMIGSFTRGSVDALGQELAARASRQSRTGTAGNLLTALGSAVAGSGASNFNQLFGGTAGKITGAPNYIPFQKSNPFDIL